AGQGYQQTSPNPKTGPISGNVTANGGGGNSFRVTSSGSDTYGSTSATAASASNPCANSAGTLQTDGQPCGQASTRQAGTMTAVLRLKQAGTDPGDATIVSIGRAATQSYGFTNRDVTPQPGTG